MWKVSLSNSSKYFRFSQRNKKLNTIYHTRGNSSTSSPKSVLLSAGIKQKKNTTPARLDGTLFSHMRFQFPPAHRDGAKGTFRVVAVLRRIAPHKSCPFYASSSFLLMELFEGWNRDDDDRRRYKTFVRDRALTKKWMAIRQKSQRKSYILGKGENITHFFTPHASKEGFFLSSLVVFLTEVELVVLRLSCFSSSVVFLLF